MEAHLCFNVCSDYERPLPPRGTLPSCSNAAISVRRLVVRHRTHLLSLFGRGERQHVVLRRS